MIDTLLSRVRPQPLALCGALLAVSALAACDNNEPVSPPASAKPTAPSAYAGQIPPTVISWKMLDENNAVVKYDGALFELTGPLGYDKTFYDNSYPEDGDATLGQVKMVGLAAGQYKVCQLDVANGFSFPAAGAQCFSGYLNPGGQLSFTFFNPRPPYLQWASVNDVNTLLGGGATFTVKDSLGAGLTVTDDQLPESSPQPGSLQLRLSHPGTWTICETAAPAGYVLPVGQTCTQVAVNWGKIGWGGSFVSYLPYSMHWGVTDGVVDANNQYVPLGGATFTVAYQRGLSKTTIADNGPNDYDPRPGRVAMKLGAAGSYTVCEVTAPAQHWLPKPPCQTVNVAYATPVFVGWFITPQAQVPNSP